MKPDQSNYQVSVKHYYDHNTSRFLSYGAQQHALTIHRSVWGKGVNDPTAALHYVNQLILTELETQLGKQTLPFVRLLDLGCGVGASLFYLAEKSPIPVWGLGTTISLNQAKLARDFATQRSLDHRCTFIQADFHNLPFVSEFNFAFAVEAFAHTPNGEEFFNQVSRTLKPGGGIILCDDVLIDSHPERSKTNNRNDWLDIFQWGWGVPGIFTLEEILVMAQRAGLLLIGEQNLTPYLHLRFIPGFFTQLLAKMLRNLRVADPYWRSVIGGQALQQCYRLGYMEYRFLVFQRQ